MFWNPHAFGEDYCDSVLELLKHFQVRRYTQVGGVSDAVPHTRPLLVTGIVPEEEGKLYGIQRSNYQGPTSITYLIPQEAAKLGVVTMNFLVGCPTMPSLMRITPVLADYWKSCVTCTICRPA